MKINIPISRNKKTSCLVRCSDIRYFLKRYIQKIIHSLQVAGK